MNDMRNSGIYQILNTENGKKMSVAHKKYWYNKNHSIKEVKFGH